ncbi:MAG: sugar transferase [Streptococcaceae bacterium]|jgi:lipopolysaccharide/colanic/teichoic acid biosynthesis glycosyltransferase|nr:sugar transferase [Streptococcaceae bacterium]
MEKQTPDRQQSHNPYVQRLLDEGLVEVRCLSRRQIFVKRLIDLLGSTVGVFICLVFMIILFIPYHFGRNRGPMFYKQKRYGQFGETFQIYKFRTMIVGAEEMLLTDPKLFEKYQSNGNKLEDDPRVTRLGRFLRKFSVDELPQFFNVFIGEMALIGPRPILEIELEEYGERLPYLQIARPGLSGYWTTHGRSKVLFPERADMELEYLRLRSTRYDLHLLWLTVVQLLKNRETY